MSRCLMRASVCGAPAMADDDPLEFKDTATGEHFDVVQVSRVA
jgi:hypothetical protein